MGRTNINIDDALVENAMPITGAKSKREVVDIPLRRLVEKATIFDSLRRLRGKYEWDGDIDAWRAGRPTGR